jgi:hypothetical protein
MVLVVASMRPMQYPHDWAAPLFRLRKTLLSRKFSVHVPCCDLLFPILLTFAAKSNAVM